RPSIGCSTEPTPSTICRPQRVTGTRSVFLDACARSSSISFRSLRCQEDELAVATEMAVAAHQQFMDRLLRRIMQCGFCGIVRPFLGLFDFFFGRSISHTFPLREYPREYPGGFARHDGPG